jgi:putative transposase
VVIAFIDAHRDRFGGVAPICRVLAQHGVKIAPRTYYAAKTRAPSARSVRDAQLVATIRAVHADRAKGRGVAGYRKVWHLLRRDGVQVARCTVARLMRRHGLHGAVRGRRFRTTIPDASAPRPADLVQRDFRASAPNRLWCVDFTYVPTWSGMAFTAFVTDVFSRLIVGWRTASRMPTELPLDALEMALWVRAQTGADVTGVIHHSDAGSQGGFNWSSQRLDVGGVVWVFERVSGRFSFIGGRCRRRVVRRWRGGRTGSGSGRRSLGVPRPRMRALRPACPARWGSAGSVTLAA